MSYRFIKTSLGWFIILSQSSLIGLIFYLESGRYAIEGGDKCGCNNVPSAWYAICRCNHSPRTVLLANCQGKPSLTIWDTCKLPKPLCVQLFTFTISEKNYSSIGIYNKIKDTRKLK
jgi:hypothetical protein